MKKGIAVLAVVMSLAGCTSVEESSGANKLSRDGTGWWQELGEADSSYWWVTEYDENMSE